MEVHHHSHTSRKKWSHYFWEFLMLFLAVFCGFLAEYQLEHKIESDRGKQYVRSMYEDLQMDTSTLNSIIENRAARNQMFDSLLFLIDNPEPHLSYLYYAARYVTRTAPIMFINNDRTIQQLKFSGGLRLIRNKKVSDSIMLYDRQVRLVLERQENELSVIRDCLPYLYRIFDGRILAQMVDDSNRIHRPLYPPPLLSYSKPDLQTFIGYYQAIKGINRANMVHAANLKEKSAALLMLIKHEYHFE